jgi:hypothetical protein
MEGPVLLVTFEPHTTQTFQLLNVTRSRVLKSPPRSELIPQTSRRQWTLSWNYLMTSSGDWWKRTDDKLFRHCTFSLKLELNHIDFYSMRKSWRKVQSFESCGRLTPPSISRQRTGVTLSSIGSIRQSETTWPNHIHLWLIRHRISCFAENQKCRNIVRFIV